MHIQDTRTCHLMGTTIELFVVHPNAKDINDEAERRLIDYEKRFSANNANSELMKINNNAGVIPIHVASDLYHLIKLGKVNSIAPHSALNIAIGPLVQTWRIGFSDAKIPKQEEIDQALHIIDPNKIHLNDDAHSVFLEKKGMKIDLGALAKGYFADLIITYYQEMNAVSGMINLGGNVKVYGQPPKKRPNNEWYIGIQNPKLPRGQNKAVIQIINQSVVTSGIYERQLIVNGKHYHHIFDSHTGYPVDTSLVSLTIISDSSLDGEIWTTRLFTSSPIEIMRTTEKLKRIGAIVITQDDRVLCNTFAKQHLLQLI